MNIEKATQFIMGRLSSVYCDDCIGEQPDDGYIDGRCDDCHRKMMNWGISEDEAKHIAETILKESE